MTTQQQVEVKLGPAHLLLPLEGLQRYPDSLLTNLVASACQATDATADAEVTAGLLLGAEAPAGDLQQHSSSGINGGSRISTGSGSSSISISINIDELPSNPLTTWEVAPAVVTTLYR